jgi:hypothetical protein
MMPLGGLNLRGKNRTDGKSQEESRRDEGRGGSWETEESRTEARQEDGEEGSEEDCQEGCEEGGAEGQEGGDRADPDAGAIA